jgi:DNA (cytosine-5)-methyltransferase 1
MRCALASEIEPELRALYAANHEMPSSRVVGDVREVVSSVPNHDVLFAGFPCQPFSKSGSQDGLRDRIRGTLFFEVFEIARRKKPHLIILENVGNFPRHDGGRTWQTVRESLEQLGYSVRGTEPKAVGGHGLISPHHFGHPHHRERFFAVAAKWELPNDPFPKPPASVHPQSLANLVAKSSRISEHEMAETRLSERQIACIEHWNSFLGRIPADTRIPSFPLWGDEARAVYPINGRAPAFLSREELEVAVGAVRGRTEMTRAELLSQLPSYASRSERQFPDWKRRFIKQNRDWFGSLNGSLDRTWLRELKEFPNSLRKLEWNCQGEERDLWQCVLQFRPSGLRAKRYVSIPALVAMTLTQVPILGPERRYLTRSEGARAQGFDKRIQLPRKRSSAFAALGNAVHVGVAGQVLKSVLATAPANYRW